MRPGTVGGRSTPPTAPTASPILESLRHGRVRGAGLAVGFEVA